MINRARRNPIISHSKGIFSDELDDIQDSGNESNVIDKNEIPLSKISEQDNRSTSRKRKGKET